jgi:hypothetical protein
VDWVLLWGAPESIREIKSLVAMIEQAQAQLPSESQQQQVQQSPQTSRTAN